MPFAKKGDQIVDARGGEANPFINIMCFVQSRLTPDLIFIYLGIKENLLKEDWIEEETESKKI